MNKKLSANKNPRNPKIGTTPGRALGPVPDLETYVHPDWWRRIFNSMYLKTDGDVVEDKNITKAEVDLFLEILKPQEDDRILDLCCGQGRHSLEFYHRGFKFVEGVDRSHYLIQKARAQARKEDINIRWREGDARKLPFAPDTFDVVTILGNSFGYFETLDDDVKVLKELCRILKPSGKMLIDIADGHYLRENFQPRSWEWINKRQLVNRERSLSKDEQRLISREVVIHVEKGVLVDQFYAERLYSRESIDELLKTAGFSDIRIHSEIATNTERNQDLGMMARRIVITGTVRKEWSVKRTKSKEQVTNVVVVMGDPDKQDSIKPSLVFDDDDYYTIDQLKDGLNHLPGYRFTYLNKHDTLLQDLMRQKGKIDYILNLCDEGFNNLAVNELHVPALLEMMDIPYSGSDPQCLAYCYDKSLIRGIASEMNIPVAKAFLVNPEDSTFELPFGFPVIAKPNYGDSSFGITAKSVAYNLEGLLNAISDIRNNLGYEKPILVEELLTGKDLSLGVIGNPPENYRALPIIEEDYSVLPEGLPKICGYEAKWDPESPYWKLKSIPADLSDGTEKIIIECSIRLCDRLEVRDYSRFDWRLDSEGNPRLLEVNPNPGWCWDGHLAKMAKLAGMNYSQMLHAILQAAEARLNIQTISSNVTIEAPSRVS
ncbi:MAG: methyltransferase domain-containing protein [bacterium]